MDYIELYEEKKFFPSNKSKKSWTQEERWKLDYLGSLGWPNYIEEIKDKTGKTESDVIKIMRKNLRPGSFRLWRKRVHNTSIKHRKKFKLERKKLREKVKITDIYWLWKK